MSDERDKMLAEFVSLTGCDDERAEFYLQSSNWDLQNALGMYFDTDAGTVDDNDDVVVNDDIMTKEIEQPSPIGPSPSGKARSSRFATIRKFKEEDDSSSDEERRASYAGGSVTSGQQILDAKKNKKRDNKNITQGLFEAAKEHGAETVVPDDRRSQPSTGSFVFKGAAYMLGSDVQPSRQVSQSLSYKDCAAKQDMTIKFWKDGFSIDSGPLRDFKDPENKQFLDAIRRGEIPQELRREAHHGEVHLNMEDHSEEAFVKPKYKMKAFTGEGHKLGSPSPDVVEESNVHLTLADNVPLQPYFSVDETMPITTIQIRLADGTRLAVKFNHCSTVGDIRMVVRNARPNTANFNLMTTFPNKVLSDDSVSIVNAKLLNAVVIQRLT